jgi:hypothetical protein
MEEKASAIQDKAKWLLYAVIPMLLAAMCLLVHGYKVKKLLLLRSFGHADDARSF